MWRQDHVPRRARRRWASAGTPGAPPGAYLVWNVGDALPAAVSAETFTRASAATYRDSNGILRTAASGTKRDGHYSGGNRYLYIEGSRTNVATNSNVFSSGWTLGDVTATASAATGPDNVALSASSVRETATTPAVAHGISRPLATGATMAQNNRRSISIFVKPTASRMFIRFRTSDNTDATFYDTVFNLSTGAIASQSNTTAHPTASAHAVSYTSGWWRLELTFVVQTAGSTTGAAYVQSSADGTTWNHLGSTGEGFDCFGYQDENTTSSLSIGSCSSYIETAASQVARAADICYWTMVALPAPQNMTAYVKFLSLETENNSSASHAIWIGSDGSAAAANWRFARVTASATPRGLFQNTSSVQANGTSNLSWGDVVEFCGTLNSDGSHQLLTSLNGGADNTGTGATTQALGAWAGNRIYLGTNPAVAAATMIGGIARIAIELGSKTMAQMRVIT